MAEMTLDRRALLSMGGLLLAPSLAQATNRSVSIHIDSSGAPECGEWAAKAARLAVGWWPTITRRLASPGFQAPDRVRLILRPADDIAATTGAEITVDSRYVMAHPEDTGLVAHELTHVVQAYPRAAPSWLTEGIADYIRYYVLLTHDPKRAFDKAKLTWRDGYQPSAALLDFAERKFKTRTVEEVNRAMRRGEDGEAAFRRATGSTPDAVWQAYLKG